jgi:hypothetical protein
MKKTLLLFLLALPALSTIGQTPVLRDKFPSDYKRSPCAPDTAAVCRSVDKVDIVEHGSVYRGFDISPVWLDAHWDELITAFTPLCTKAANCFTVKSNDWVFCFDLLGQDFLDTCLRFPEGSEDRKQCRMVSIVYYLGTGGKSELQKAAQDCAAGQPAGELRNLTAWVQPGHFDFGYDDDITVYAYDSETHIPVRARLTIDGGTLRAVHGMPASGGTAGWRAGFKHVTNARNRRELVVPTATLEAEGYNTLTFPFPIDVPTVKTEVTPPPAQWKTGKNTITITATDSATGKPAELRVMAGDTILGNTNQPVTLNLGRGKKHPEIWLTSLFEQYGDVVVVPKQ